MPTRGPRINSGPTTKKLVLKILHRVLIHTGRVLQRNIHIHNARGRHRGRVTLHHPDAFANGVQDVVDGEDATSEAWTLDGRFQVLRHFEHFVDFEFLALLLEYIDHSF